MIPSTFRGLMQPVVEDALSRLAAQYDTYPAIIEKVGHTNVVTLVLGIMLNESSGNPYCLGDPKPGYPVKPSEYWTPDRAMAAIDNYNSVGLGQLNFGAGTPQGLGFQGPKDGLFDAGTNAFYTTKNIMHNLRIHNADAKEAIRGYNGSNKADLNHNGVSDTLEYFNRVMQVLGDAGNFIQKKNSLLPLS